MPIENSASEYNQFSSRKEAKKFLISGTSIALEPNCYRLHLPCVLEQKPWKKNNLKETILG